MYYDKLEFYCKILISFATKNKMVQLSVNSQYIYFIIIFFNFYRHEFIILPKKRYIYKIHKIDIFIAIKLYDITLKIFITTTLL
jgi:hypothetical protein